MSSSFPFVTSSNVDPAAFAPKHAVKNQVAPVVIAFADEPFALEPQVLVKALSLKVVSTHKPRDPPASQLIERIAERRPEKLAIEPALLAGDVHGNPRARVLIEHDAANELAVLQHPDGRISRKKAVVAFDAVRNVVVDARQVVDKRFHRWNT